MRTAFSVDEEDHFYLVEHEHLFKFVRECIEYNSVVSLQCSCINSMDNFLELLYFYLKNIFVSF